MAKFRIPERVRGTPRPSRLARARARTHAQCTAHLGLSRAGTPRIRALSGTCWGVRPEPRGRRVGPGQGLLPCLRALKDELPPPTLRPRAAGRRGTSFHTPIHTHLCTPEREGLLSQAAGAPLLFLPRPRPDPAGRRNPAGVQPAAKPQVGAPVPSGIRKELMSDGSTGGRGACHRLWNLLCWGATDFSERLLVPALGGARHTET